LQQNQFTVVVTGLWSSQTNRQTYREIQQHITRKSRILCLGTCSLRL